MRPTFSRLNKASLVIILGWFLAFAGGTTVAIANVVSDPGSADRATRAFVTLAFAAAQLGLGLAAAGGVYRLYAHAQRIIGNKVSRGK